MSVTLHLVSSLDGYIARPDNDVAWLEDTGCYEAGVTLTDADIAAFVKTIDCYVLGSRTYEHALQLGWVYGDTPTVVVTTRQLPAARTSVSFYAGDLTRLVREQLAPRYRKIWLAGGAQLAQQCLRLGLVDEIRLTMAPVLLGGGLRLFDGGLEQQRWNLKDVAAYRNAFVELTYCAVTVNPAAT